MSATLRERLDNLEIFLNELYRYNQTDEVKVDFSEIADQANYPLATMDCLNKMLEGKE